MKETIRHFGVWGAKRFPQMTETGLNHKILLGNVFPVTMATRDWLTNIKLVKESNPKTYVFDVINYPTGDIPTERRKKVEEWKFAPSEINYYGKGSYLGQRGKIHQFNSGARLLIGREKKQVMDSCEGPWCEAVVKGIFNGFPKSLSALEAKSPKVFLRGFGLGQQAIFILRQLIERGAGELHIAELNLGVINNLALEFMNETQRNIYSSFAYGKTPELKIILHIGDALEITKTFMSNGTKFDVIISDTYPLSPNEQGINDLLDLRNQVKCLNKNGRFSFFPYFPEFKDNGSAMNDAQQAMVQPYFDTIVSKLNVARVDDPKKSIGVPPDYKFLQRANGPVEYLPIVICTDRRDIPFK